MSIPAPSSSLGQAGTAPGARSCDLRGTIIPLPRAAAIARGEPTGAALSDRRPGPGLSALSFRDEEIVLRSRAGELPHDIARALDHDLLVVMRALNRALLLGLPIRP